MYLKLSKLINKVYSTAKQKDYYLLSSLLRFGYLSTIKRFSPVEIFSADLLNPDWTRKQRQAMISKENFLKFQGLVNPESHRYLTEDKVAFHFHAIKNGLPVPQLIAVINYLGKNFWPDNSPIKSVDDLIGQLGEYPFDIICKPVNGVHGKGIVSLQYQEGRHLISNGPSSRLETFFKSIIDKGNEPYLLQRKLYSHDDITNFTGNPMLQSLRLITIIDASGEAQLIIRKIKFPAKGSEVDNFEFGVTNGRLCTIDQEGKIVNTLQKSDKYDHLTVHNYVKNGSGEIENFNIPMWNECVELVLEAQHAFSPLKSIGWDVAVTNDGIFLIEGNIFWDPLSPQIGGMADYCRLLSSIK